MAHLAFTIDPDPARRQQFLARASDGLGSSPGLKVSQASLGELAIAWGHGPCAPQSSHSTDAEFSVLVGYAVDETDQWIDARALLDRWIRKESRDAVLDGYHIAVAYSVSQGLTVGVDPVGIFPFYHAQCGGNLVAASSPELLSAHPHFEGKIDLSGLAGILLTNGLIGGRALLQGVTRLGPGCQLRWTAGRGAHEVEICRLKPRGEHIGKSFDETVDLVHSELRRAIRRHRPPQSKSMLLLSGGLDSRLMAGYLQEEGITDLAVSLGQPEDFEVRTARRITAVIGMRHYREPYEPGPEEFVASCRRVVRWEHLAAGFSNPEVETFAAPLGQSAPLFWSGFALDEIVGGAASQFSRDPETGKHSFERFSTRLSSWGLPVDQAQKLFCADGEQLVREQMERLRRRFEREEESPSQRAFRMKFETRTRFHIGALLHRRAHGTWPLLPVFDWRLLNLFFNVNSEFLIDRNLERHLLARHFPPLARVLYEHNSFRLEPVQPTGLYRIPFFKETALSIGARFRRWYWRKWRRIEPRRYYRFYNPNGPLWLAARREAEAHRNRLDEWLDKKEVDALLPSPETAFTSRNRFGGGSPQRILLGLALWSATRNGTADK